MLADLPPEAMLAHGTLLRSVDSNADGRASVHELCSALARAGQLTVKRCRKAIKREKLDGNGDGLIDPSEAVAVTEWLGRPA